MTPNIKTPDIKALDILSRDSLRQRAGGVWEYVSPSRLNLWLRCPLAFKLKYVDGVETAASPALFVGKAVHAALESYYRHRQLGLTIAAAELTDRLNASWGAAVAEEHVAFSSVAEETTSRQQAVDLVAAYVAQLPPSEPRPLAVEAVAEAPLVDPRTGDSLGLPLVGVMDLVLPDGAGPVICDFKTASRGSEPLEVTHEVQLSSYSYLFRTSSAEPESALEIRSLIKTKVPKIETHRYASRDQRHFGRLFAVIRAYLDDLDSGRFIYRPGIACGMCDFRHDHCRCWAG